MKKSNKKTILFDRNPAGREKQVEEKSASGSNEECRCKEVSKKTFPEMIKLMLDDLAFWKKEKK